MNSFSHLSADEFSKLVKAPLYIGLLIAEADGEADHKEIEWIEKVTYFRIKTAHHTMRTFYRHANEFIKENCVNYFFNDRRVQSLLSKYCGYFCCLFILKKYKNYSFLKFLKLFFTDYDLNDKLIEKLLFLNYF